MDPDGATATLSPVIAKRYLHGPAVDQILAQENLSVTDVNHVDRTYWMLTDHQGSVRDLVRKDGTIAAHYQYDSFGKPLDGLENITAFGMNGQRRDTSTGFIYAIGRWYDPVAGRWLSEDFSLGPDSNPYRYVGNSAPNWNDANGREKNGSWLSSASNALSTAIDILMIEGAAYPGEVWRTGKGYFYNGPKNAVIGAATVVAHPIRTSKAAFEAAMDPVGTFNMVCTEVAQKVDSPEGQGEIGFDIVTSVVGLGAAGKAGKLGRWGGKLDGVPVPPTRLSRPSGFSPSGFNPPPGTRVVPEGIPKTWRIRPTDDPGGVLYFDPAMAHKSHAVRVMPGKPTNKFLHSQSPYVRWQKFGQALDKDGCPVSKFTPDAHIPLDEFKFNPELFK